SSSLCRSFGGLGFGLCGLRRLLRLLVADRDDLQNRVLLAMTFLAPVIVAAALLEHRDLLALGLGDDLRRDGEAAGRLQIPAIASEQDVAERDLVTGVAVELLDDDLVSRVDAILLSARAHDCEHCLFSSFLESRFPRACERVGAGLARESRSPMAGGKTCQPRPRLERA